MHRNVKNKLALSFKRKPTKYSSLLLITDFKIHKLYILVIIVVNKGSNLNNKAYTVIYQDWYHLSSLNSKCSSI